MGRSMYQYGNQTKEKARQIKQVARHLQRSLAKQQLDDSKKEAAPAGEAITEKEKEHA